MNETILSKDEALRTKVSNALAEHPDTRETAVEVINENGVITLVGEVKSAQARQAAAAIAAEQPGVISVTNSLKVTR